MTHEAMELLREFVYAAQRIEDNIGPGVLFEVKEKAIRYLLAQSEAAPDYDEATITARQQPSPETTRTFDARTWAKSFNETLVKLGYQPHDEGWLIGWFANAIMCGHDHALSLREKREGMVEVPIEPTAEMKREGAAFLPITPSGATLTAAERVWSAMLAAAPPAGEVKKKGPSGEMA